MARYSGQYIDDSTPTTSTAALKQTQVRRSVKLAGTTAVVIGLVYLLWRLIF